MQYRAGLDQPAVADHLAGRGAGLPAGRRRQVSCRSWLGRMKGVIERMRFINVICYRRKCEITSSDRTFRGSSRRVDLLQRSLLFAIGSGVAVAAHAHRGGLCERPLPPRPRVGHGAAVHHLDGAACVSLGLLAVEVRIGLNEFDPQ